ncbi:SRPBCC family protein [Serinicoccus kebangsaanensis]|uniref:SRPBCC family protein n=1 Tax=Serinicoccus kebangsaanensis TaxID=2602069 RepID=UPI00124E7007|nr:SRPBCC family protein [Serinicoccus kebangsaanensis]
MPTPPRPSDGGREFRFHEDWTLPVEPATVLDRLVDLEAYPTWWRQVRLVEQLASDRARVRVRSLLPAPLHLTLVREREDREAGQLRVGIEGDLQGYVEVQVTRIPAGCRMVWEQRVLLTKPGLRHLAALPPVRWALRANHAAMMRSARAGLGRDGPLGPPERNY